MVELPDIRALVKLPAVENTGIGTLPIPEHAQRRLDHDGLWWAAPFAMGATGCEYAFRLTPGPGHGAVLRCLVGHAVTVAASPDRAVFAIIACERLLRGEKSRALFHEAWGKRGSKARKVLREAVTITGGNPDELDDVVYAADALPKWRPDAPPAEIAERRAMLRKITGVGDPASWTRWEASAVAPKDVRACVELLQGNHGLDGTTHGGGLMPGADEARALLVACAKKAVAAKAKLAAPWAALVRSIAKNKQPVSEDFIKPIGGKATQASWEALAASGFWYRAVAEDVPQELVGVAESIARELAPEIVEARRALVKAKRTR